MTSLHQVLLPGEADSGLVDDRLSLSTQSSSSSSRPRPKRTGSLVIRDTPSLDLDQSWGGRTTATMSSAESLRCIDLAGIDTSTNGYSDRVADDSGAHNKRTPASEPVGKAENSLEKRDVTASYDHNRNCNETTNVGSMQRTRSSAAKTINGSPPETSGRNGQHHTAGLNGVEIHCTTGDDDKATLAAAGKGLTARSPCFGAAGPGREMAGMLGKLFACFLCGIVFGIAAEKGRVFETATIRGQFIYQRWIMLKMFLSAAATSCFSLALLAVLPMTRKRFEASRTSYVGGLTQKGVVAVIVGGAILGVGMVLAGSCPGMVLVQIGAWLSNGGGAMTFFGALVAVYAYAFIEPWLTRMVSPTKPYEKLLADSYTERWKIPFFPLAVGLGLLMGLVVVAIELFVPWTTDLPTENVKGDWFFQTLAWPPYISGIMIGAMQIPLTLIITDTMGGSSSYCTLASQILITKKMETWLPYLAKFKRGLENWWQVFYVGGAIVGGCLSAAASGSLGSTPGVSLVSSFFGGFLLLFGARLAGGCTSGHGLSGMGVLSVLSFITVAAMFAGGTAFGFIFWAVCNGSTLDYWTF